MIRIIPDGIDCYAVMRNDAPIGWISKSHWHGKFRALSLKDNRLTLHLTRTEAVNAIVARAR